MMRLRPAIATAVAVGLVVLASCSDHDPGSSVSTANESGDTIAGVLKNNGFVAAARALDQTGLSGVFSGSGSYTLLVPTDQALRKFEDANPNLRGEQGEAALAMVLREHMMPGYVTPDDLRSAIHEASHGKVTMRSLGEGNLVFSYRGNAIIVTSPDGAAAVSSKAMTAGDNIAIPVDGILEKS
jgi:uncharacterized surface protein with fasciclin (FAS1) repeats